MTEEQILAKYPLVDIEIPYGIQEFYALTKIEKIVADLTDEER